MSSELVVMNKLEVPVFQNEYLTESVRKIIECSRNIIANHFQIAYELASIKKLELYKEAGYESVTDFAEKVFGFSKTSTSLAIKVAERYLIDEGDRIATTFLDTGTDFSFNQLRETLPLSERKVSSLVFNKKLKPTMTVKQIRAIVQEEKNRGSFDVETEENKGINLESTIDISSISSSHEEHELKNYQKTSEKPQNAPESTENSSVVSNYQETSEKPVEGSGTSQNSLSDSSISYLEEEQELKQEQNKDLEELMKDIPKELREYILMLEEENKKLREEVIRLTPVRRKRGRPKKER